METFRALLLEHGYDGTTTQMLLDTTGLSKAAMYHQFRSKSDLMAALYEREAQVALSLAHANAQGGRDPLDELKRFYLAWVDQVRDPPVARLLFEIGPFALGYGRTREIEDRTSFPYVEGFLAQGKGPPVDLKLLVIMLNAIVGEAALYRHRTGIEDKGTLPLILDAVLDKLRFV